MNRNSYKSHTQLKFEAFMETPIGIVVGKVASVIAMLFIGVFMAYVLYGFFFIPSPFYQ